MSATARKKSARLLAPGTTPAADRAVTNPSR